MRLFGFIVLAAFCLENCSCFRGFSVRPRVTEKYNYGSYTTTKPRIWEKKPNSTQILQTAAEVFESLGNASLQSFASTFQNIKQQRLFTALKGLSIVAQALSTQFHKEGRVYLQPNSNVLANTVKQNVEKLSQKVFSNTNFYFSSINNISADFNGVHNDSLNPNYVFRQQYFNSLVVGSINKTSSSMIAYMNNGGSDDPFTNDHYRANMDRVLSFIIHETPILLGYQMNVSQFNEATFEEYRSNITRYFFQAFIIEYVHVAIQYGSTPSSEDIQVLDATFRIRHRQFIKLLKEKSTNVEKSFFPGTLKETLVRPVIDQIVEKYGQNGSNCLIAGTILHHLDTNYPTRKYLVIVDDTRSSTKDHYAYFGFPKRSIVDDYRGKTVLIFMATKNATENKIFQYMQSVVGMTLSLTFDGKDLNTALEYARSGENYYQMVAIDLKSSICFAPKDSNFSDQFTVEKKSAIFIVL